MGEDKGSITIILKSAVSRTKEGQLIDRIEFTPSIADGDQLVCVKWKNGTKKKIDVTHMTGLELIEAVCREIRDGDS